MVDAKTIKEANAKAAVEAVKAVLLEVNEENRQDMGAGHRNAAEVIRYILQDLH